MSDSSLPVILFGKLPAVTTPQIKALLPEIKVTHLITSLTSARTELPALLSPSSNRAAETTHSLSQQRRPVIIIVGGGFTDEEFEELRVLGEKGVAAGKEVDGKEVVWLRAENTRVPESEWPPNPVYPGRAAGRIKDVLRERGVLERDGMEDVGRVKEVREGEVLLY